MTRIDRAALLGVVANGEDVVEGLIGKLIYVLRAVPRNIDSQLPHDRNGFRTHLTWLGSGAEHLEAIARVMSQKPLRHLAAGGIAGAKNQDTLPSWHGT